jgi:hypothetical protein
MSSFEYKTHCTLLIYPSQQDSEDYLPKTEQFIEALNGISQQAVFEIRKKKGKYIFCSFYGEKEDIFHIQSAYETYFPNSITEISFDRDIHKTDTIKYVYDFVVQAEFHKTLTDYESFNISPLNSIVRLLSLIPEDEEGVYQVIIAPLPGGVCHNLVKEAIDTEWKSQTGGEKSTPPSLQVSAINKNNVMFKSKDFRNFFGANARIILPTDKLFSHVKAYISSYTYGLKPFAILDNRNYSEKQIESMDTDGACFHTGWCVNSFELVSMLHVPHQVIENKKLREILVIAPAGDKPLLTADYKDVEVGTWACNSKVRIRLPTQIEIPHVHILGVSRQGKSVLLAFIVLMKFLLGEAVFVLDPHGDLISSILRMIPKDFIKKVIVIDFSLDEIPQLTIKGNLDITDPSLLSDNLTESMKDVGASRDQNFWGPKMAYFFTCLYYIYSVLPDLNLAHIRQLASPRSKKGKVLREKVKSRIDHPIIREFLDELSFTSPESIMPVLQRLSHLLLPEKSMKLFTQETNKISISDIMENGKLCLVNLSIGTIGKQRSSILSGLMDSLINNNILARANVPYNKRKPCTLVRDEFYLGNTDLDAQLTGLAKYGLSVIFANQYLNQVEGNTREVLGTAGSRLIFRTRMKDAEILAKEFGIEPEDITSLRKFQAFFHSEGETVKINTPKPEFPKDDYSKEIMQNCLDKYYLKHEVEVPAQKKEKLLFDELK